MGDLVVRGASVWRPEGWVDGDVVVRGGVVVGATDGDGPVLDGRGLRAVPGYVDLQCNGALGIDLATEPERLWELAAALPRWGVTAWLPTIVTSPPEVVERALATLAAGPPQVVEPGSATPPTAAERAPAVRPPEGWVGAVPLGLHLEGPFLNPARKGAHPAPLLRPPGPALAEGWSRDAGVALVTLAPELDGALDLVAALAARGVVVSLGHSEASSGQATAAVEAGATWVTHLFNAMGPLHHREPGLPGVALADERLRVGLIADGIHVHPTAVAAARRALGERLTLVTDAVAALGVEPGPQRLGGATVTVGDDGVRLADGTLAGSALSMDRAVRNLVAFTGCDLHTAVHAATAAPAAVAADPTRGSLEPGSRGDLALLAPDGQVVTTVVGGVVAYDGRRPGGGT